MCPFRLFWGFFLICGIEALDYYIEDAYIEEMDPEYFDEETTVMEVVWVNVTSSGIAFNITLLKTPPEETMVHFDLWLKTMGEYKTHSGITASLPWCEALNDPILLGSLLKALGMEGSECPPAPGHYGTAFWQPTTELMPESFPGIDYKITFSITIKKKIYLLIWAFLSLF